MKLSKLVLLLLLFCFFVGSMTGTALAHSPQDILIEFDENAKIFKVKVTHPVARPEEHFIDVIRIFINKKLMVVQNFNKQSSKKAQEALYVLIDALPGSEIIIETECNVHGSLRKEFVLEKPD